MERLSKKGDFERQLRDYANQYKMYPSKRVWKGIQSSLHHRRRRFTLSLLGAILITTSVITILIANRKPPLVNNTLIPKNELQSHSAINSVGINKEAVVLNNSNKFVSQPTLAENSVLKPTRKEQL